MSMMKKTMMGLFAGALAAMPLASFAEEAAAEESDLSASLDLPVLSAYTWRGQVLVDDPVVQPTFTISKGNFWINWWGNFNIDDQATGNEYEFSEHDITAAYSFTCPLTGAGVTLGIVNYDFPNPAADNEDKPVLVSDTREAFLTYSFADVLLAPTLNVYYDFKEAEGFYGSLGIGHSFELAEIVSLSLGATLGAADKDWAGFYYAGADDTDDGDIGDSLTDYSVSASLPIAITDSITLTPGVQYIALLGDAKDAVDSAANELYFGDTDKVIGSLKASFAF